MIAARITNENGKWRVRRKSTSAPIRVLIIDDEVGITKALKLGLEHHGFRVTAFNDPAKAIAKFKAGAYDMVLTDIRMPTMMGFEVWERLRKKDGKLKVAFISAYEEYKQQFLKLKPRLDESQFLQKPVALATLVERLKMRASTD